MAVARQQAKSRPHRAGGLGESVGGRQRSGAGERSMTGRLAPLGGGEYRPKSRLIGSLCLSPVLWSSLLLLGAHMVPIPLGCICCMLSGVVLFLIDGLDLFGELSFVQEHLFCQCLVLFVSQDVYFDMGAFVVFKK